MMKEYRKRFHYAPSTVYSDLGLIFISMTALVILGITVCNLKEKRFVCDVLFYGYNRNHDLTMPEKSWNSTL